MDSDGLTLAAEYMPIFPLIGGFIGLVAGVLSWILDLVLPPLLVGTIGLGTILLMNGAQHVDGLLDFGDGIMCHGSRARKLSVMRDPQTGAGGFTLGWITLSATAFAIASLHRGIVIQAIVVSEAAGAFSMVFQAWAGHPAHKGMSSGFVTAMHSRWRNLRIRLVRSNTHADSFPDTTHSRLGCNLCSRARSINYATGFKQGVRRHHG